MQGLDVSSHGPCRAICSGGFAQVVESKRYNVCAYAIARFTTPSDLATHAKQRRLDLAAARDLKMRTTVFNDTPEIETLP